MIVKFKQKSLRPEVSNPEQQFAATRVIICDYGPRDLNVGRLSPKLNMPGNPDLRAAVAEPNSKATVGA